MTVITKTNIFLFLFFVLSFYGCISHNQVNPDIILQTGEVKLTRSDWKRQLNKYQVSYKQKYKRDVPLDSVIAFRGKFIDYSFILAGAYFKGYQFKKEINENVLCVSKIMMCQKGGPLFKHNYLPKIIIDREEIDKEIEKSKKTITISVIKFKNKAVMLSVLKADTLWRDGENFEKYVQRCTNKDGVSVGRYKLSFPYDRFLLNQDLLTKMNKGDVSKPIQAYDENCNSCIYIFHIECIEKTGGINNNNISKVKQWLEHLEQEKLYAKDRCRYLSKIGFTINDSVLHAFLNDVKYGSRATIDTSSVNKLSTKNLVSYHLNQSEIKINVRYYVNYFNNYFPLRRQLHNIIDYINLLQDIALYDVEYPQAIQLGLTSNLEFLSKQHYYLNSIIAEQYQNTEIFNTAKVTDNDAMIAYNLNKNSFKEGNSAEVSIFIFSDFMKARQSIGLLQRRLDSRNGRLFYGQYEIRNVESFLLHHKISFNSNTFDKKIVDGILNMPDNTLTNPIPINNKIYIFKKETGTGVHLRAFDEVKVDIKNMLIRKKEMELLQHYLTVARTQFNSISYFTSGDYSIN